VFAGTGTAARSYTLEGVELCDRLPHKSASAATGYKPACGGKRGIGGRVRLALFEPDIPQNAGALLRLAACLGVAVDLIEPCGFLFDDRRLKRAGLDYIALAKLYRHASWTAFLEARSAASRLVLLTTAGSVPLHDFAFAAADTILLGRESAGVPLCVHRRADARVAIPLCPPARSLNVALAGAIALAEALRQTGQFPPPQISGPQISER
jgi:tRNA (cytidine/uridine-2'-O-)-methyltransferase